MVVTQGEGRVEGVLDPLVRDESADHCQVG